MPLKWTSKALADLVRLHEFLVSLNPKAAAQVIQSFTKTAARLMQNPRLGIQLQEFNPREVRRIIVAKYEMRYEISQDTIYILRVWHTREHR
jgi:plasmid stabilization system protein ParE